jgi:2-dehydropantoate 2-reductase
LSAATPESPHGGLRHVVLGLGGVGGLVAGLLARSGADVRAIVREAAAAAYPGTLSLSSAAFGDFDVPVPASSTLDEACDVLWITVKAPQLGVAIESLPPALVGGTLIIPLLNGIDHVDFLRAHFPDSRVIAASIRVAAERTAPGTIVIRSPFAEIALAIDTASRREAALDAARNVGRDGADRSGAS